MSTDGAMHANHRARMRERFRKTGLDGFEDHAILELLLFEFIPRVDTNPIAHRLMNRFGTLEAVFSASPEELMEVDGIGPKSAAQLSKLKHGMLFQILDGCDFSEVNYRLGLAAEYHMRHLSEGTVSLFSREIVLNYTSDGGTDGLHDAICSDLAEFGITDYAVVVKTAKLSDELEKELARGEHHTVCILDGEELIGRSAKNNT